jgi:Domain of unknown function (DUF4404)
MSPTRPPTRAGHSPSRAELQSSLERLHAELAASEELDTHSRALLQMVLADIQRVLAAPHGQPAQAATEGAPERLEQLAVRFEVRHPLLAGSIRQFVDLLSRAGL